MIAIGINEEASLNQLNSTSAIMRKKNTKISIHEIQAFFPKGESDCKKKVFHKNLHGAQKLQQIKKRQEIQKKVLPQDQEQINFNFILPHISHKTMKIDAEQIKEGEVGQNNYFKKSKLSKIPPLLHYQSLKNIKNIPEEQSDDIQLKQHIKKRFYIQTFDSKNPELEKERNKNKDQHLKIKEKKNEFLIFKKSETKSILSKKQKLYPNEILSRKLSLQRNIETKFQEKKQIIEIYKRRILHKCMKNQIKMPQQIEGWQVRKQDHDDFYKIY